MDNYADKLAKESGRKVARGYLGILVGILVGALGLWIGFESLAGKIIIGVGVIVVIAGYLEAEKYKGVHAQRSAGAKAEKDTSRELGRVSAEYKTNVILPGRKADIDVVTLGPALSVVEVKAGGAGGEVQLLPTGQLVNRHGKLMLNGKDVRAQVLDNARRLSRLSGAPVYAVICLTNARMQVNTSSWPGVVVCNLHYSGKGYEGLADVLAKLPKSSAADVAKVRRVI